MAAVQQGGYTEATLCFPMRGDEVLVAEKQAKIGSGRLNGFGGKIEPHDEDVFATNIREVKEEVGLTLLDAQKVGEIRFHNPLDDLELARMRVHLFTATQWLGEPVDTSEMKKATWYRKDELDYSLFLAADRLFLPYVFNGKNVSGLIEYNEDWTVKTRDLDVTTNLE